MSDTRCVLITDQHFGVKNDSKAFVEYFERFYSEVFFPYIDENNIKTVIVLGDLVERRKYINYMSLRAARKQFIEPLVARGLDVHMIVGNHDCPLKHTNDVNAIDELFSQYGLNIYHRPTEVDFEGIKALLIPWITTDNYADTINMIDQTSAQITLGHLELAGFELLKGINMEHGMSADIFNKFDMVLSGHYHHKSSKGNVHYLGVPYELTWSDHNDPKGFHVFDFSTRELTFIRNPLKMFVKIEYADDGKEYADILGKDVDVANKYVKVIVRKKTNPFAFDQFIDKIQQQNPHDISIVDEQLILDNIDVTDESGAIEVEDTVTIFRRVVDNLDVDVEKSDLISLLTSLYVEAQQHV